MRNRYSQADHGPNTKLYKKNLSISCKNSLKLPLSLHAFFCVFLSSLSYYFCLSARPTSVSLSMLQKPVVDKLMESVLTLLTHSALMNLLALHTPKLKLNHWSVNLSHKLSTINPALENYQFTVTQNLLFQRPHFLR